MRSLHSNELLWVATFIGVVATAALPWLELRGVFAAWRVVEWHTFWRGESAFTLTEVVAANYRMTIEFATTQMRDLVRGVFVAGAILGVWHAGVLSGLLVALARARLHGGVARSRVAREIALALAVNLFALGVLTWLSALPSSLDTKIDFRPGAEAHTDSLIWSSVTLLPVAPAFAALAVVAQVIAWRKK